MTPTRSGVQPAERLGYASMISMDDVDRWSRLLDHVRQTLFVLDACFSGLAGVQRKGPLSDKTLAGISQYGHHLITAGTANEESVASVKLWGGSLFTDAFLRGASGRADASTPEYPADGVVSLKELLEYIRHRIDFESQKNRIRMSPQISDLEADNAGEFFFLARTPPIVGDRQTEEPVSATALTKGTAPGAAPTSPVAPAEPTPSEIARAQTLLAQLGYNPGPADGSLGRRTRVAVEAYQRRAGLPIDGAITPDLLASLLRAAPAPPMTQPVQPAVAVYPPAYKAFEGFKDCDVCPPMVALPGGTFTMGSPADDPERDPYEGPQHRVTIEPFAIGKTEVTFAEWDACVSADGCNDYKPEPLEQVSVWGSPPVMKWVEGSRPVINVSWKNAKTYVTWLSQHARKPYRLPSEAEWEYAARAGTLTRYAFGDAITPKDANYSESKLGKTTEVGAYPPNAWGLHDMHGNASEWVEDIWHDSYKDAPTNGTAWIDSEGENSSRLRVIRGGSWYDAPRFVRSAARSWNGPDHGSGNLGFRVARTLN